MHFIVSHNRIKPVFNYRNMSYRCACGQILAKQRLQSLSTNYKPVSITPAMADDERENDIV